MKPQYRWYVEVEGHRMLVDAPSKNNAAIKGFRTLIKMGKIKNRPKANNDGGWDNTFIICKGRIDKIEPLPQETGIGNLSDLVEGA